MYNFKDKTKQFAGQLTEWYRLNHRDLPWRSTSDPYKIWLSEIILQQTRVLQGLNYYLKFIKHYPTVKSLAEASEEDVLKDWQGLGYYSRARNLHAAAKYIKEELNNKFPSTYKDIKALKGVGDYTAAAVSSFAYDLPYAVVDGNVYRVLSRLFAIDTPIDSTQGKKDFAKLAQELLDVNHPAEYNQAIMEFGAMLCTPKNPKCETCPFKSICIAFKNEDVLNYPVKAKKTKQRNRYLNYLIITCDYQLLINYRSEKGIWQNLYDFPLIETKIQLNKNELVKNDTFKTLLKNKVYKIEITSETRKHILSHQILYATFYHVKMIDKADFASLNFEIINKQELARKPIPKLIENYLNEETNLLSLTNTQQ